MKLQNLNSIPSEQEDLTFIVLYFISIFFVLNYIAVKANDVWNKIKNIEILKCLPNEKQIFH